MEAQLNSEKSYIPLESAKGIIITALDGFHSVLAVYAADIFSNNKRLNIVEVTEAQTNMMMCRPAGITLDDIQAAEMVIPDFLQKYGPKFSRQDNPEKFSIIDFEYDGTPLSMVWLAHELGHAIADDVQIRNGKSFRDFSFEEMERQAYFVQNIVSQYLRNNLPQYKVENDDLGDDVLKMSWARANQFTSAARVFEKALDKDSNQRINIALDVLGR